MSCFLKTNGRKDVMTVHRDKIKASKGETKPLPLYTNDYYGLVAWD
jgi:hypothetical protein